MATIIVEDGSIVSGANSYVSEADLAVYAADRGLALSGTASELLILSMDYLEGLDFIGVKVSLEQDLQWPRGDVVIDGYGLQYTDLPKELKQAQMAIAMAIDAGNSPLALVGRATKREKVDVLEVEYMDGSNLNTQDPNISNSLRKLLRNSSSGTSFKVDRA